MYVHFMCENPNVFEVDTDDLCIKATSVDNAIQSLYEHLWEQLNPEVWAHNDFSDCVTVEDCVEKFRWYITLIALIQKKEYECTCYSESRDDPNAEWDVLIPLCKYLLQ